MDLTRLKFDFADLAGLDLASIEQQADFLKGFHDKQGFTSSTHLTIREQVAASDVFLYLLGRFGPPNGVLSFARSKNEAMKSVILWHYTLSWRRRLMHVVAHPFSLEVVFSCPQPVDLTEDGFAALIKEGMRRHSREVAIARKQVTHWHSFLNPLSHMLDACDRMLVRARWLDESLVKSKKHPVTPEEITWHETHHEEHASSASELSGCCLAVRMMAPVLAEMFVNLIIYNQYRANRPDGQEKEEFTCASILARLKNLHVKCDGFARPVDMQSPQVRAFTDLMNRRNDLLHGNIRPSAKKEDEFLMYEGVPIIKGFRSIYDRALGPILNAFPLKDAEGDYAVARGLLDYLLECLEPAVATELRPMLDSLDLHQERNDKKLKALFTNIFVDSSAVASLYRNGAGRP